MNAINTVRQTNIQDVIRQNVDVSASPIGLILLSKSTRRISLAVKLCAGQAQVSTVLMFFAQRSSPCQFLVD